MLKRSKGDLAFDIFLCAFMALLAAIFLYPFLTVLALSFNDARDTAKGGVYLWPRKWSFENYKTVFSDDSLLRSYGITIARTVLGTVTHVICTATFAYALSKKYLMFRKVYLTLCVITMFFGGGLIPSVITLRNLGFTNSFWVYIIPNLYGVMDMLIMKSFFNTLPPSLEEAARIDGANDLRTFFQIVVPNAKPVLATIALQTAVGQWNSWFDAYIYNSRAEKLWPVQMILQKIVLSASGAATVGSGTSAYQTGLVTPYSIQLATLVVAIGPIILIYPFFQRYFVKGFMIGAIKE